MINKNIVERISYEKTVHALNSVCVVELIGAVLPGTIERSIWSQIYAEVMGLSAALLMVICEWL